MIDYIVGIDPGKNGGIAIIDKQSNFIDVISMPCLNNKLDYHAIINYLQQYHNAMYALENCWYRPIMKGKGAFTFAQFTEGIEALLICTNKKFEKILPAAWQKTFGLLNKDKEASIQIALQLYPEVSEKLISSKTKNKTKYSDGRAEALLIATHYFKLNISR